MFLEDVHAPQPLEDLVRRELKHLLATLMDNLTDRQRQVLRLRFGMEDGNYYSLEKLWKDGTELDINDLLED